MEHTEIDACRHEIKLTICQTDTHSHCCAYIHTYIALLYYFAKMTKKNVTNQKRYVKMLVVILKRQAMCWLFDFSPLIIFHSILTDANNKTKPYTYNSNLERYSRGIWLSSYLRAKKLFSTHFAANWWRQIYFECFYQLPVSYVHNRNGFVAINRNVLSISKFGELDKAKHWILQLYYKKQLNTQHTWMSFENEISEWMLIFIGSCHSRTKYNSDQYLKYFSSLQPPPLLSLSRYRSPSRYSFQCI